ncbi:hypothetical protein [Pseudodesulfovibrio pelocollis]|uniref:hypothetical protein n=1 Tax=Pseudodesulfovibrio pelocollis TaxID=3051432 RepID=UPI00255AD2FD|nr:hypothetical protein [Pseudodesulfovibrio sp. SB368]
MSGKQARSRDLGPDRARCADYDCPAWEAGCARAETQLGLGRYCWLPLTRPRGAKECRRRIDPVTLKEGR